MIRGGWLPKLALVVAAVGVLVAVPHCLLAPVEPPSIELIVAALNAQVQAAAVDVDFSQTISAFPGVVDFRYVRTKDIQYMYGEKPGSRGFCLFDRKHSIGRQFSLEKNRKRGWIRSDTHDMPLQLAGWPDPVLCLLHIGNLIDVLREGTVSSAMEKVDGQECWRVSIKRVSPALTQDYEVWLDPNIGFCPRRTETAWKDHLQVCTLSDYKEIGTGVWFPMTVRWESPDEGVNSVTEVKVTDAKIVTDPSSLKLETAFPSGTKVQDMILDARYTVP